MKFDAAVKAIERFHDLRRVSSAHVVDHSRLDKKEMRNALLKVKPQYLHDETVKQKIEEAFYQNNNIHFRNLSQLIIRDILLNEDGFILPADQTEERVMGREQKIVNRSNEIEISDLASKKDSERRNSLDLYFFVLKVAWEYEETKSPDEVNLLRKLRNRLNINDWDHAVMEAKLGKYPKINNEIHSRKDINDARNYLQSLGLLFPVRDGEKNDFDVIPEELAQLIRKTLNKEIKEPNYFKLIQNKYLYKRNYLREALERANLSYNSRDTLEELAEKVIQNIPPSILICGRSSRDGLNQEDLHKWCAELNLPVSGTKQERVERIIAYYDSLRQTDPQPEDERVIWYEMYEALAIRDYSLLRAHNIINRDSEVDKKFEEATSYLFQAKLKHTPLKQIGSNRPDGLLSFKDMYVMWDNKSKEGDGQINLRDHMAQFHEYMENADKIVPIFLVIGPGFTEESDIEASKYKSQHIDRNIVLITAKELKTLAEEWNNIENKKHDEPFPLSLLGDRPGRVDINHIKRVIEAK